MLWYNLKLAYRNITKNKQSYLLNFTGLVIGLMVSFITLFYVIYEYQAVNKEFNLINLYAVKKVMKPWNWMTDQTPVGVSDFLREQVPGVEDVILFNMEGGYNVEISPENVFKAENVFFTDSIFLKHKTYDVISGNKLLRNPTDVLITKALALKYFGAVNCVGKCLYILSRNNQSYEFTISGVIEYPIASELSPTENLIVRLDMQHKLDPHFDLNKNNEETKMYLNLTEDANATAILNQMTEYITQHIDKNFSRYNTLEMELLKTKQLKNKQKRINAAILISSLILMIALFNFIIHNNARFWERSKTMGIRKMAGSKPTDILKQIFTESFVVNLICVTLALVLAITLLPSFKTYLNDGLRVNIIPFYFYIIIGFFVALVFSVFSSFSGMLLSSQKPIHLVNRDFSKGKKGKLINSALIMMQVGVFTFLLIMFFTSSRQLKYINTKDWGFDSDQLISLRLGGNQQVDDFVNFKNEIQSIPEVINAAGSDHVPPSYNSNIYGSFSDKTNETRMIEFNKVDYDYLKTLGVKIMLGRDFDFNTDKATDHKIIINQSLADLLELKNPLDTLIKVTGNNYQPIVGVVEDFHIRGMDQKIRPLMLELSPEKSSNIIMKVSSFNMMQTIAKIEKIYRDFYPKMSFDLKFIDEEIQNLYEDQKKFNSIMIYYAIIAISIACMGLFGFVLNEMNKRIKEVGIRKVNGARIKEIIQLLNYDFIGLCLLAIIVASPLAYFYAEKWLNKFAYKTSVEWWIFMVVGIAVLLITLATVSFQTIRVARRNPVEALRYE